MASGLNADLLRTVAGLEAWLRTVRQPGGFGGPVAHWWRDCLLYTGPGIDWRYEGILAAYRLLYERTGRVEFRVRLREAAADVLAGQRADGLYRGSRFEENPGVLGTPHEAAATLGLLDALPHLPDRAPVLAAAQRNLAALIERLWDQRAQGFDDRPGVPGRVPNKLATMAEALLRHAAASGEEGWLPQARAALDAVVAYQVPRGACVGAVHQYAAGAAEGDGRFFPYYNARCVPPLLLGAQVLGSDRYREAAEGIVGFLERSVDPDGLWPQVVYAGGGRAPRPRWIAGAGDTLRALRAAGRPVPVATLRHLVAGQLASGGLRTADGFARPFGRRAPVGPPDWRDLLPVAGWNDKAFRAMVELLPAGGVLPEARLEPVELPCLWAGRSAVFREDERQVVVTARDGGVCYRWVKAEPWAMDGKGAWRA